LHVPWPFDGQRVQNANRLKQPHNKNDGACITRISQGEPDKESQKGKYGEKQNGIQRSEDALRTTWQALASVTVEANRALTAPKSFVPRCAKRCRAAVAGLFDFAFYDV
jgi:hypothetical protein